LEWSLGMITEEGSNPSDINRGRIIVRRDMKLKYDLIRARAD
jgi:hypothetical protein